MLAPQTQYCCPRHIGMMNVSGQQSAKIIRVLAGAAAAALMRQKLDPIYVLENSRACRGQNFFGQGGFPINDAALPVQIDQSRYLPPVYFRRGKPKLLFKGLLQRVDISVFTKDERYHQPIIPRADLSVASLVAQEGTIAPPPGFGRCPVEMLVILTKGSRLVRYIPRGDCFSSLNFLSSLADQHPVHEDTAADRNRFGHKLMFSRHVRRENILLALKINPLSLLHVMKRDQHIVARVELEYVVLHKGFIQTALTQQHAA